MGALPKNTIGNIKLDVEFGSTPSLEEKTSRLKKLGFEDLEGASVYPLTLIGASTWPGEEALLLKAQKYCIDSGLPCQLIIVPRHVERRGEIQRLLNKQSLPWASASGNFGNRTSIDEASQAIYLSDTTGQLIHSLNLADLAFIGKSMSPNMGGQTPIEAAAQGIPILLGPNMSNFKTISEELIESGAARCVTSQSELNEQVLQLAKDSQARTQMHAAGLAWHEANKGIISEIGDVILQTLI